MATRKSTGKRTRFEVFKRDHFTCQYCGAQPPDVLLVVDHITPVSKGGGNDIDNLITACEPCNQGKTDKQLTEKQVRPDADLLYLETQQEIAELRRFQLAKAQRDAAISEIIEQLNDTWQGISGMKWVPGNHITRQLLTRYGPEITEQALVDVAGKIATRYLHTYNTKWVQYLYAVARNMARQQEDDDFFSEDAEVRIDR